MSDNASLPARGLFENRTDVLFEVDVDFILNYVSPNATWLLGYDIGDILGHSLFDFMLHEDAERLEPELRALARKSKPFSLVAHSMVHRDGRIKHFELSAASVFDKNGQFSGYRAIDRDVTERKSPERPVPVMASAPSAPASRKQAGLRDDFMLDAVVRDAVSLFAATGKSKQALRSELAADVPLRLRGDPEALSQVLIQVSSKALERAAKPVLLSIRCETQTEVSVLLRFEIPEAGLMDGAALETALASTAKQALGGEFAVLNKGAGSSFWFLVPFLKQTLALPGVGHAEAS